MTVVTPPRQALHDTRLLDTVTAAGEILSVSDGTVRRLLKSRELEGVRIGRALRVTRASIEKFVAERISSGSV